MTLHTLRHARALALLALALVLPGCSSWQPLHQPIAEAIAPPDPVTHVRVLVTGEGWIELDLVSVDVDSLRGHGYGRDPAHPTDAPKREFGGPVAIARADVMKIESRQTDGTRTALMVVGSVCAILVVAAAVAMIQGSEDALDAVVDALARP